MTPFAFRFRSRQISSGLVLCGLVAALAGPALHAWDRDGHRIVAQTALATLPPDFPAFVRTRANTARIEFLSSEPDRWSHASDVPLKHHNWPDHFFDLEMIPDAGLDFARLPSLRYEFVVAFAAGRAAHASRFRAIDPARNADHTQEWPGFLPWTVVEHYGMLRAAFGALKVYEELGTSDETANARANIVYLMGILSHYVGDSAQPLHTTVHFNGWTGKNPRGYTTWPKFHSWIDSGFIVKAGVKSGDVMGKAAPARPLPLAAREDGRDPVFVAALEFLLRQHKLVEPLYQLEKDGKFGRDEQPITDEARAFIEARLREGGEMLGAIWLTAWQSAVPENYLRSVLGKRQAGEAAGKRRK